MAPSKCNGIHHLNRKKSDDQSTEEDTPLSCVNKAETEEGLKNELSSIKTSKFGNAHQIVSNQVNLLRLSKKNEEIFWSGHMVYYSKSDSEV